MERRSGAAGRWRPAPPAPGGAPPCDCRSSTPPTWTPGAALPIPRRPGGWWTRSLQRRLEALPDVRRVGYIFGLPFTGFGFSSSFRVDGGPEPADGSQSGQVRLASAGYFPAQGIPLLQGRGFSPADRRGRPPVVL